MSVHFSNAGSGVIIKRIADVIVANKAYLSEIDGKIGDGDHGINMAKGFARASERINGDADTLNDAMSTLSDVLMSEIGGSMGPLYGMMFVDMADSIEGKEIIDGPLFAAMLRAGLDGVSAIGEAKPGDKTLLDTLTPAVEAMQKAVSDGTGFAEALDAMTQAAATGRDSTIGMIARVGRSSRLGERSRGVLDAGATSCHLILAALADGARSRLEAV